MVFQLVIRYLAPVSGSSKTSTLYTFICSTTYYRKLLSCPGADTNAETSGTEFAAMSHHYFIFLLSNIGVGTVWMFPS